jgi:putative restriction endonuclease
LRKATTLSSEFRLTLDEFPTILWQFPEVRYWWVRHDKSFRHEVSGGYIWAQKRNSDIPRSPAHETILGVAAGDGILSCAEGRIGHVGRCADPAIGEHGREGEGWWLPVDWTWLPAPVAPATPPPSRLAEIPETLFHDILSEAELPEWPLTALNEAEPAGNVAASRLDYDAALTASVRDRQVKARRGQSLFRFRVFQIEMACRLTGIANPDLLIASHIKPWRLCETTHERLDGANGLLLTPHVDRLFDRGLISFSDQGEVLRSAGLAGDDLARLGLDLACRRNVGSFSPKQRAYLEYHRRSVFERSVR